MRSAATVRDVEILGTSCVADQIGNGCATASGEAFEGSELERLHEDLHTLGFGHGYSMCMCMCMSMPFQARHRRMNPSIMNNYQ